MPDRWRLGTRNPNIAFRVADGAHDGDHAREHFVTAFRREEDARRAVDAVNAPGAEFASRLAEAQQYVEVLRKSGLAQAAYDLDNVLAGRLIGVRALADVRGHSVDHAKEGVEALAALAELVALKDGDRGEEYERRKPLAWSRARQVLGIPEETTVPQPPDDEPAEPADSQRAAPTRDVYVWVDSAPVARTEEFSDTVRIDFAKVASGRDAGRERVVGVEVLGASNVEVDGRVLAALRGAGADGGGEDEDVAMARRDPTGAVARVRAKVMDAHALVFAPEDDEAPAFRDDLADAVMAIFGPMMANSARMSMIDARAEARLSEQCAARDASIARLVSAAGVDPDAADPVGEIERVIREGREVEVVSGDEVATLPRGTRIVAVDHEHRPRLPAGVFEVNHGVGPRTFSPDVRFLVYRAPAPAPAPLAVGEVVTGDRAVDAPVGTTLGRTDQGGAAWRNANGWWAAGVGGQDGAEAHEHAVRINEWVVLALGGES